MIKKNLTNPALHRFAYADVEPESSTLKEPSVMYSVILVDDHPAIRLAIRGMLQQTGRFTITAETDNGQEAIEIMRQNPVDIMLIDLDIPRISGLELISRIRSTYENTKLLVLSAQDETVFAPRAMQAGADGFVSKTRDSGAIMSAIDAVLSGYSYFPRRPVQTQSLGQDEVQAKINSLSDRELTVLQQLAHGLSNKEIADGLFISNKTVSTYKANIKAKLGVDTLIEIIDFAREHKLV